VGVLWELHPGLPGGYALKPSHELPEVLDRKLRVRLDAPLALHLLDGLLENVPGNLEDYLPERLDEAPVGILGEARVAGAPRQTTNGGVVEAEVQDGVHHPGHRDGGPAPDRDQQWVLGVAEPPARLLFQTRQVIHHLGHQAFWQLPRLYVGSAGLRRYDEALRDREAEPAHAHEPTALTPAQGQDIFRP
jgi:hypothetical protein